MNCIVQLTNLMYGRKYFAYCTIYKILNIADRETQRSMLLIDARVHSLFSPNRALRRRRVAGGGTYRPRSGRSCGVHFTGTRRRLLPLRLLRQ